MSYGHGARAERVPGCVVTKPAPARGWPRARREKLRGDRRAGVRLARAAPDAMFWLLVLRARGPGGRRPGCRPSAGDRRCRPCRVALARPSWACSALGPRSRWRWWPRRSRSGLIAYAGFVPLLRGFRQLASGRFRPDPEAEPPSPGRLWLAGRARRPPPAAPTCWRSPSRCSPPTPAEEVAALQRPPSRRGALVAGASPAARSAGGLQPLVPGRGRRLRADRGRRLQLAGRAAARPLRRSAHRASCAASSPAGGRRLGSSGSVGE